MFDRFDKEWQFVADVWLDEDDFDEDAFSEESYRTTYEASPEELDVTTDDVADDVYDE